MALFSDMMDEASELKSEIARLQAQLDRANDLLSSDELLGRVVTSSIAIAQMIDDEQKMKAKIDTLTKALREIDDLDDHGRFGRIAREAIAAVGKSLTPGTSSQSADSTGTQPDGSK